MDSVRRAAWSLPGRKDFLHGEVVPQWVRPIQIASCSKAFRRLLPRRCEEEVVDTRALPRALWTSRHCHSAVGAAGASEAPPAAAIAAMRAAASRARSAASAETWSSSCTSRTSVRRRMSSSNSLALVRASLTTSAAALAILRSSPTTSIHGRTARCPKPSHALSTAAASEKTAINSLRHKRRSWRQPVNKGNVPARREAWGLLNLTTTTSVSCSTRFITSSAAGASTSRLTGPLASPSFSSSCSVCSSSSVSTGS
mmetsp:Transcript_122425/g.307836  ORF Transcript_122425/g.307836 Transcript_122425/m.307836 type:complete len:256 (-) Transcript_122425:1218-1985(-)